MFLPYAEEPNANKHIQKSMNLWPYLNIQDDHYQGSAARFLYVMDSEGGFFNFFVI